MHTDNVCQREMAPCFWPVRRTQVAKETEVGGLENGQATSWPGRGRGWELLLCGTLDVGAVHQREGGAAEESRCNPALTHCSQHLFRGWHLTLARPHLARVCLCVCVFGERDELHT